MLDPSHFGKARGFVALSFAIALTISISSCGKIPTLPLGDTSTAAAEVQQAKKADKKAHDQEAKEFEKEKQDEKAEDREFAKMKRQLEKDKAEARAHPNQHKTVSRLFFDEEILAINERIHALSVRLEHMSERVHKLSEHVEDIPEQMAALKLELLMTENEVREAAAKPKTDSAAKPETADAPKPKAPRQLAKKPSKAFWGIQLGAYKTKAGAEEEWTKFQANPMAVELSDAKVHYVPSKPLKSGKRLTLIVVNEYPNFNAANGACNTLKGNGIDCVAYHVKP